MKLVKSLENEKQIFEKKWQAQLSDLHNTFNGLKLQHEADLKSRDTQIQELQQKIGQLKEKLEIDNFKKETGDLNTLLSQQQVIFGQNLAMINDLCKSSDSLVNHLYDMRTHHEEISEKISGYIS